MRPRPKLRRRGDIANMPNVATEAWAELVYHFDAIVNCIHLRAFIASLPIAFTAHFFGNWHLLEIWFMVACVDLLLGILLARKLNEFSWLHIGSWSFKIFVHACTIIAVGILAHAASIALEYDVLILNLYMTILIGKELGSAVRNAKAMQWPIPHILIIIINVFDKDAERKITELTEKIFQVEHPQHTRRSTDKKEVDYDIPPEQ